MHGLQFVETGLHVSIYYFFLECFQDTENVINNVEEVKHICACVSRSVLQGVW